ncbi:TetR/AcrR family transcriptional regulator [Ferrovibrio sp.]|uniref:TetR/AcrR family transcriptional regulator n=1 Tax=Ferrovibrio sp. TaxID=1917215 RepID=UPI003D2D0150
MAKREAVRQEPKLGLVTVEAVPSEGRAMARRRKIITEAARQFVKQGFDGTSMRDIAAASGIMAGSLYYHFASKEDLFVAVHATGMDLMETSVKRALIGVTDPWARLEAAAEAHCEALVNWSDLGAIVTAHFSPSMAKIQPELIVRRDRYEVIIKELIAALDLPAEIDPAVFRLHFLGALNWIPTWYRAGGEFTPARIGRQLVRMLRDGGKGKTAAKAGAKPAKRRVKPGK